MTSIVHAPAVAATERSMVVPYITTWSEEIGPSAVVEVIPGVGIGYADESIVDRGTYGVLWQRMAWKPGAGRPLFGRVHPLRQRRAMRKLLCQVCGGPADQTDEGVLWLLKDHRDDWPGWPNRVGMNEPPICLPCVGLSVQLCPALRKSAVAVRAARYPVAGVRGVLYKPGPDRLAVQVREEIVSFTSAAVRWIRAHNLVRELDGCTLIEVAKLT